MDSVPIEIAQLGLGVDDYIAIAHNVKRMLHVDMNTRQRILDRASSDLSDEVAKIAIEIPIAMAYDREFFSEAELDYSAGPPRGKIFISAVADYLLRNQDKLKIA